MAFTGFVSQRLVFLSICVAVLSFASPASAQKNGLTPSTAVAPATDAGGHAISAGQAAANSDLATFAYTVTSSRDAITYTGAMVGEDPFGSGFSTTVVDTPIIPVILITNTIAVASPNGKILTTQPGVTVFNPTAPDDVCLKSPNDVPLTLMVQSPLFQAEPFTFGP